VVSRTPLFPFDIVTEDVIPAAKRVTMTIALWKMAPTIRVVVDRPIAGARGGPYSASFDLEFAEQPGSFLPQHNTKREGLFRWIQSFLVQAYPRAPREAMVGRTAGPTGVPFVDATWPALLPPEAFGIDELRITTQFNPVDSTGGVLSVELVFSTPESVKPPLPKGIPNTFLFSAASPEGVSVELHFDANGAGTLQQIDGAILLEDGQHETLTALPLQWSSKIPTLFAGSFDAAGNDADPPFYLFAVKRTMGPLAGLLEGLEPVLIHQAELTCDLATGGIDFVAQAEDGAEVEIGGLRCSDVTFTLKWDFAGTVVVAVLRGFAALDEPRFFRVAQVWRGKWISAIEANHRSSTREQSIPLAVLVSQLPEHLKSEHFVDDGAVEVQILSLPEQRRGTENDFNDLIGE
jgi:hypothetical protein